jgi:hypothetical protein
MKILEIQLSGISITGSDIDPSNFLSNTYYQKYWRDVAFKVLVEVLMNNRGLWNMKQYTLVRACVCVCMRIYSFIHSFIQ